MTLLEQMLPGQVWDPSPLLAMLPSTAPDPVLAAVAGIEIEQGVAFVPVPGGRGQDGQAGPQGAPGVLVGDVDAGYF